MREREGDFGTPPIQVTNYRVPMGPGAELIGKRITIRLRRPEGGYRDLMGILETLTCVRKADGSLGYFTQDEVALWREITPAPERVGHGAPLSHRIHEIEMAAHATWPALVQKELGGWLLRASGKFTMRANSVLPMGDPPFGNPGLALDEAIAQVIAFYDEHNITPVFHIPLPTYAQLDSYLESQGWITKVAVDVMVADITHTFIAMTGDWEVHDVPTDEWLSVQNDFGMVEMMKRCPSLYAGLRIDGKLIAVGRSAQYENWSSFSRFYVVDEFRRRGFGLQLVHYLLQEASRQGATKAMLQVDSKNEIAINLYKNARFRRHHSYVYRVLVPTSDECC